MNGDPFHKVQTGDKLIIPAQAYNAFIDATRAVRGMAPGSAAHGMSETGLLPGPGAGLIKIKNTSDAAVAQFGILGIDDILFSPTDNLLGFKRQPVLKGVKPLKMSNGDTSGADHTGKFVVMLEPVDVNAVGVACVSGVTITKINITRDTYNYADIYKNNTSYLRAAHVGSARILWRETGTGYKWALVCLQSPAPYGFGKITALKTSGGADWTDYLTNNEYPFYVEANPCSDLIGGDTDTTITIKLGINPLFQTSNSANAPNAMIAQVGTVVGYMAVQCFKPVAANQYLFDGWVVPYMGCWPDWTRAH
ncbi:MAG: hypothetical protein ACYC26_15565 [Phycisphaerales bacterium]